MLVRLMTNILGSLCLSVAPVLLMSLFARRRSSGQPGIVARFFRTSFYVYYAFLTWLQMPLMQTLGVDVMQEKPRRVFCALLSLAFLWGVCLWLGIGLAAEAALLAFGHGWFVGARWQQLLAPNEFQLGGRVE